MHTPIEVRTNLSYLQSAFALLVYPRFAKATRWSGRNYPPFRSIFV